MHKNCINLNVLKYGYYGSMFRIRSLIANIKQFFRNIKYAYQRIVRGYCDQDIWNLDSYISELLCLMLHDLADDSFGWPGEGRYDDINTPEDWSNTLHELAEHFYNSREHDDCLVDEFADKAFEDMETHIIDRYSMKADNGLSTLEYKYDDEKAYEKEREKWLETTENAWKYHDIEKDIACDMLKKYFNSLWD